MTATLRRVSRRSRSVSFTLGAIALLAASAGAAPQLSIAAPPFDQPLTDLRPTVAVSYSTSDPAVPLNVASLLITVRENGRAVAGTTTVSDSSATFVPSSNVAAGTLIVEASISDIAAISTVASRSYEVLPTYQALTPTIALAGETLTVTALGLDPDGPNYLVFASNRVPGVVDAPLDSIDPDAGTATVRVPKTAASGSTYVKVNGQVSTASRSFTLRSPYTFCGTVNRVIAMADGSLVASHSRPTTTPPGCPSVDPRYNGGVVSRSYPNGSVSIIDLFRRPSATVPYSAQTGAVRGMAADRTGIEWALLLEGAYGPGLSIRFRGRTMWLPMPEEGWRYETPIDFDRSGNLVMALRQAPGMYGGTIRFVRIPAASLRSSQAGDTLPIEDIATHSLGTYEDYVHYEEDTLRVSCSDRFYFSEWHWRESGDVASIYEGDLTAGSIVKRFEVPGVVDALALSCHTGEVYGVRQEWDPPSTFWRWSAGSGGIEDLDTWDTTGVWFKLVVLPSGTLLSVLGTEQMPLVVPVEPCTDCSPGACNNGSAQPFCPAATPPAIAILPSTTRWKPQRSDAPIVVEFSGPDDLDLTSGTLEITGPAGTITFNGPITRTSPTGPFTYRMEWTGPWTYTDPADGQVKRLPPADYAVVVVGRVGTAPNQREIRGAPYGKVSLVEVKRLDFVECGSIPGISCQDGGARLDTNTGTGAGRAAYPDATQPGGDYRRTVLVKAQLEPNLGQDAGQVTVHFRFYDVDDPSASTAPVDDDSAATTSTENRNDNALLVPSVTASPDQGGAAISFFQVSTQQGNNYRLAASTHEPWLGGISGVVSSQSGDVTHASDTLTQGVQVSEMLTVWRTLHLEVDQLDSSMVSQATLDLASVSTKLEPIRLEDDTAPFKSRRPDGERHWDHADNNDWRGGDLWPHDPFVGQPVTSTTPAGAFKVRENKGDFVKVASVSDLTAAATSGDPYRLRDDHWVDLRRDLPLDLTRRLLRRAYIDLEVIPDGLNAHRLIPFDPFTRNLNPNRLALLGHPAPPSGSPQRDAPSSQTYWSVMGIVGFDAFVLESCDPCGKRQADPSKFSNGNPGRTLGGGPNFHAQNLEQPVFAVFLETIRDIREGQPPETASCSNGFEDMLETFTAHEIIAHALGVGNSPNNLTDEGLLRMSCTGSAFARQLGDQEIGALRAIEAPKLNAGS